MNDVPPSRPRKAPPRKTAPKPPPGGTRRARRSVVKKVTASPTKIKLRGRNDGPLSIAEACQGLYDAIRVIQTFDKNFRIKWATVYMTIIDSNGHEVTLVPGGEMILNPYECAADEFGA